MLYVSPPFRIIFLVEDMADDPVTRLKSKTEGLWSYEKERSIRNVSRDVVKLVFDKKKWKFFLRKKSLKGSN